MPGCGSKKKKVQQVQQAHRLRAHRYRANYRPIRGYPVLRDRVVMMPAHMLKAHRQQFDLFGAISGAAKNVQRAAAPAVQFALQTARKQNPIGRAIDKYGNMALDNRQTAAAMASRVNPVAGQALGKVLDVGENIRQRELGYKRDPAAARRRMANVNPLERGLFNLYDTQLANYRAHTLRRHGYRNVSVRKSRSSKDPAYKEKLEKAKDKARKMNSDKRGMVSKSSGRTYTAIKLDGRSASQINKDIESRRKAGYMLKSDRKYAKKPTKETRPSRKCASGRRYVGFDKRGRKKGCVPVQRKKRVKGGARAAKMLKKQQCEAVAGQRYIMSTGVCYPAGAYKRPYVRKVKNYPIVPYTGRQMKIEEA